MRWQRQEPTAYGPAPHKPVLHPLRRHCKKLDHGQPGVLTPELVAAFRNHWSLPVTTHHSPTFTMPFSHLQSSGFWPVERHEGNSWQNFTQSLQRTQVLVHYDTLNDALYALLACPNYQQRAARGDAWQVFSPHESLLPIPERQRGGYLNNVKNEFFNKPAATYSLRQLAGKLLA